MSELMPDISIIIPALNEAESIAGVIASIRHNATRVIVADNGSTDGTGNLASAAGAQVIRVEMPGYGRACLAALAACPDTEIVVFMDGDAADDPADFEALIAPLLDGSADLVIGTRLNGRVDPGALTLPQRFGNSLACWFMRRFWNGPFTDLGPFRAVRRSALDRLSMQSQAYGWTVEMQVRALKAGLRCREVPVHYRKRIGVSKISGTVRGVVLAGSTILGVIAREVLITRGLPEAAQATGAPLADAQITAPRPAPAPRR